MLYINNMKTNNLCFKCLKQIKTGEPTQHGLHAACFQAWFDVPRGMEFEDLALKASEHASSVQKPLLESGFNIHQSSFFQGKFKKYSGSLNNVHYILKVKDEAYPELPALEYLSNQIAVFLGIEVPSFYFIRFQNTLETFVVKNFIMNAHAADLVHIYRYFNDNQIFDCENLMKIIEEKSGVVSDLNRFVDLCLFDALIGNHDRHGRNIGLVQTEKGLSLAPFYDNPSYLGIEDTQLLGAHHEPRGRIATKHRDNPTMKDYVIEFKRLGFLDNVQYFYEKIQLQGIFKLIDLSFMSDTRKEALHRLIANRYLELKNELHA